MNKTNLINSITDFFTKSNGEIELKKLVIAIIIALITALASILTSIIVAVLNNLRNKKTAYINTITSNRIEWMQKVKALTDEYIRKTMISTNSPIYFDIKGRISFFDNLSSLRNQMFLHLNYKGYLDDKIMDILNELYYKIEIMYEIDQFLKITDQKEKLRYLLKHFHTEIFNKFLESIEMTTGQIEQIQKSLHESDEIPKELQEAINTQISEFDKSFQKAPRKISNEVQSLHNKLIMFTQIYLKLEWDRVKSESKGKLKTYSAKKYKVIADDMIKNYKLNLYNYDLEKLPNYLKKD